MTKILSGYNLAGVLVMSAALLVFVGAMAINRRISDIRV